jgi:histidine triad (HIT) family protein
MSSDRCEFCEIVAGRLPSRTRYEDDELVVFENRLDWVPVMLLVVPRLHLTQTELWRSGDLLSRTASVALQMGEEYCPNGFRVLSNFGPDALQTQNHGHLHVLGGAYLGHYVRPPRDRGGTRS